ncbi:HEAT repeat domain-containing protein [Laspinema olomoucense]|uniref:HEAT repeat domain-containing protein n=1 Tax=Laspinema olomoucense D3b TaxID=2953688 RepID=A0ABT2NA53_9CYAN|nr:HEAT repeat domain-containing protein [Laspinema sp. D3b]MCT7979578.1 HEAT repeat domain-containing protein [Laspinema sp. D3b]
MFAPKLALLTLSAIVLSIAQVQAHQTVDLEIGTYLEQFKTEKGANRREAVKGLRQIGTPAVPLLITALQDADVGVRGGAAFALGSMGSDAESAIPSLIAALNDSAESVRLDAAVALRRIGTPAVEALATALQHPEIEVRRGAAFALAGIGATAEPAIAPLINALQDPDERLAWNAAVALRAIGSPAVPALKEALTDENPQVRSSAAFALGNPTSPTTANLSPVAQEDGEVPEICRMLPNPLSPDLSICEAIPILERPEELRQNLDQVNPNPCNFSPNPCESAPNQIDSSVTPTRRLM